MSVGKVLLGLLLTGLLGLALIGGCFYSGYNRAVTLDEGVKAAWAQVENQLQRRYDLLPNVVETVKGVASQEQEVFLGIAKAREAYFQARDNKEATVGDKAKAATVYESALSRLLVLKETYPELKSNQSFLKLQDTLEGTENRLAVERQRYNDTVRTLNTFTRGLLGRIYSSLAKVSPAEYFEVPDAAKAAPKVDFSKKPEGG